MSEGPTVAEIRAGLVRASATDAAASLHLRAFRSWLLGDIEALAGIPAEAVAELSAAGTRSAGSVAALGYAVAATGAKPTAQAALADGLAWLSQRSWFQPGRAPGLEADGVAALGVALACSRGSADCSWLAHLLVRGASAPGLAADDRSLMIAASHLIGAAGRQDVASMAPMVRVALTRHRIVAADGASRIAAWRDVLRFSPLEGDLCGATLALAAFDVLAEESLPARLGRLEPADVVRVLQGVDRSLRRWAWEISPRTSRSTPARWDVANEYHVQDMLWTILAPVFPDLRDEETLPPIGPKNPRVDLSIPSINLVVEVKFMRPTTAPADIIEEVAADASLYGTDPRWKHLVPFVWDDSRRTEEHPRLLAGLRKLPMVVDAVVVPRPAKMSSSLIPTGSLALGPVVSQPADSPQ